MAEADVGKIIDDWKAFKDPKQKKAHDWCLFYNVKFNGEHGHGFADFQQALIAISNGQGWDSEAKTVKTEENPKKACPVFGLYKFPAADNPKRIKILAFGYCDDTKPMGGIMASGKKKFFFAQTMNEAKEEWWEGIKGPKIKQWNTEADITEAAMLEWFMEGDRV